MTADGLRVTMGGRSFVPATQPTYRQRLYVRRQIMAAHLDELPEATVRDVAAAVSASGLEPEILAGWLLEEGQPWSEASAKANAALFAGATDPETMDALDAALLPLLLLFFAGKPRSAATSPSSSGDMAAAAGAVTPTSGTPASGASATS